MRNLIILLFLTIAIAVAAQERVEGDLIVMIKPSADINQLVALVETDCPLTVVKCISPEMHIWLLHTQPSHEKQYFLALNKLPNLLQVQYNHIAQPRTTTPNDTMYMDQWGLYNYGQAAGIPDADIDADEAWDITTSTISTQGDTIVVAVIDQGFDLNHIDINYWRNHGEIASDSIDNDGNGYIDDVRGWYVPKQNDSMPSALHGTHIAGIIGAKGNNITGVAGVHWGVKIMPVAVSVYTEAQVIEAYAYVYKQRLLYNQTNGAQGAFVVATNSSFGINNGLPANFPLWCAMYDSLGSVGILNVGATANAGTDIDQVSDIPTACSSDYLLTVTATTRTDFHNPGTAYGLTTIDLGAPGTGIMSTFPGNFYGYQSGTSMAAPFGVGATSFLVAAACDSFITNYKQFPDSFALVLKNLLIRGTDTIPTLVGKSVSAGRLNLNNSARMLINDYCITCVSLNAIKTDVNCFGAESGSIMVSATDGVQPYQFAWSTGDTSEDLLNIPTGTYTLSVTDSLGCTKTVTVSLYQPDEILTSYITQRSLDSLPVGRIQLINILGGVTPYSYLWSNGDTTTITDSLLPGAYTITITDQNGCERIDTINIYNDTSSAIAGVLQVDPKIQLYPNPVADEDIHVSWSALPQATAIELSVYTITGQQVLSTTFSSNQNKGTFNLQSQPSGIYFVAFKLNGQLFETQKLLKY